MCTPLMAQRWLLHHTALATGSRLFLAPKRSRGRPRARRGGMRWADCTRRSRENSGDVLDVLAYTRMHLPCSTAQRGRDWQRELEWNCKKMQVTVGLEQSPSVGNQYFLFMTAWNATCWIFLLPGHTHTSQVYLDVTPYTAQLHKEILTSQSLFKWSHPMDCVLNGFPST